MIGLLAHEFGHTRYANRNIVPSDYASLDAFIHNKVADNLADEGEATLVAVQARLELRAKGISLSVPGAKHDVYEKIYQDYLKSKDRDRARNAIGAIFGKGENPSTATASNYWDYYAAGAVKEWYTVYPRTPAPATGEWAW